MNLQLKQTEIVAALTSYIAGQGINLTNKTVNVVFTAGRKDSGITVAISIEDAVPAFAAVPPVIIPPRIVTAATEEVPSDSVAASAEESPAATTSLFNS